MDLLGKWLIVVIWAVGVGLPTCAIFAPTSVCRVTADSNFKCMSLNTCYIFVHRIYLYKHSTVFNFVGCVSPNKETQANPPTFDEMSTVDIKHT